MGNKRGRNRDTYWQYVQLTLDSRSLFETEADIPLCATLDTVNDPEIGAVWPGYNASSGSYRWSEYSSGGGFALHFPTPAYQKDTLSDFFENNNPRWPYFTNGHWQNGTGRYSRYRWKQPHFLPSRPLLRSGMDSPVIPLLTSFVKHVDRNGRGIPDLSAGNSLPYLETSIFATNPKLSRQEHRNILQKRLPSRSWNELSHAYRSCAIQPYRGRTTSQW